MSLILSKSSFTSSTVISAIWAILNVFSFKSPYPLEIWKPRFANSLLRSATLIPLVFLIVVNVLDKYKQKYMNTINKTAVAKQVNATIKSNEKETNIDDIKPGARVDHPKFGVGTVVGMMGTDVTIAFEQQGIKKINKEFTTFDVL